MASARCCLLSGSDNWRGANKSFRGRHSDTTRQCPPPPLCHHPRRSATTVIWICKREYELFCCCWWAAMLTLYFWEMWRCSERRPVGLVVLVTQLGAAQDRKSMPFTMQSILTPSFDKTVVAVKTINVKGTFTYFLKHSLFQWHRTNAARFNPLSFAFRQGRDVGKQLFLLEKVRTELVFHLVFFFFAYVSQDTVATCPSSSKYLHPIISKIKHWFINL